MLIKERPMSWVPPVAILPVVLNSIGASKKLEDILTVDQD